MDKRMENEKPPLGVAPFWFVYPKRIIELSKAITRYAEFSLKHTLIRKSKEDYLEIRRWAIEIVKMAETMILLSEEMKDGKRNSK